MAAVLEGFVLVATACNTIAEASPYALWYSDGKQQCVVDLSGHLDGTSGVTGISYHDGRIYAAVQAASPRILVLDMTFNVVDVIRDDHFNDLHSLQTVDDALFIVSSRNGKLLERDFNTGITNVIADFDPKAWISGVHYGSDDIWLCGHHLRYLDPAAQGGGVFSIAQGRMILDGLLRPHSLLRYRDGFVVLDSGNAQVVFFDRNGMKQTCRLQGFLRGAAVVGEDTLLVAGGPHRTISRKDPAGVVSRSLRDVVHERQMIFEVHHAEHTRTYQPELPGFEIYDLLVLPQDVLLRPNEDRVIAIEQGSFARLYYVALVDALFRLSAINQQQPETNHTLGVSR